MTLLLNNVIISVAPLSWQNNIDWSDLACLCSNLQYQSANMNEMKRQKRIIRLMLIQGNFKFLGGLNMSKRRFVRKHMSAAETHRVFRKIAEMNNGQLAQDIKIFKSLVNQERDFNDKWLLQKKRT